MFGEPVKDNTRRLYDSSENESSSDNNNKVSEKQQDHGKNKMGEYSSEEIVDAKTAKPKKAEKEFKPVILESKTRSSKRPAAPLAAPKKKKEIKK